MTLVRQPKASREVRIALALHPLVASPTRQILRSTIHDTPAVVTRQPKAGPAPPAVVSQARVQPTAAPVRFVPVKTVAMLTREVRVAEKTTKTVERFGTANVLHERLFERLVLARNRKEETAKQTPAARAAAESVGRVRSGVKRMEEARPVPMRLISRKSAEPARARQSFAMDGSEPPARDPRTAQAVPLDVEALSSRVINEIDRRLVAYRERMGRI